MSEHRNKKVTQTAAKARRRTGHRARRSSNRYLMVSVSLLYQPYVWEVAKVNGRDRGVAFVAFFRLLVWLNSVVDECAQVLTTRDEIDAVAQLPGVAAVLEKFGIISFDDDGRGLLHMPYHCEWQCPAGSREHPDTKAGKRKSGAKKPKGRNVKIARTAAKGVE